MYCLLIDGKLWVSMRSFRIVFVVKNIGELYMNEYIKEHNADMSNHHQANCGSCHQERSPRKGNLHEGFCSFCFLVLILLGE